MTCRSNCFSLPDVASNPCSHNVQHDHVHPPPPPPPTHTYSKLAPLLLLALLAGPAQAQLVIPAATGTEACTQGGASETGTEFGNIIGTPTNDSLTFNFNEISFLESYTVYAGVQEGGKGTPQQVTNLGTSQPLAAQSGTFSSLKKNTRYTFVVYNETTRPLANPIARYCFKTRGEFTNAEQNLKPDGSADLTKFGRTGCFAVASTRQDMADCMCNGTRGGTLILAGQTTGSQAARQHWGCPDLDS